MFAAHTSLSSFVFFMIYMPLLLLAIPAYRIYQNGPPRASITDVPDEASCNRSQFGDASGSVFSLDTAIAAIDPRRSS